MTSPPCLLKLSKYNEQHVKQVCTMGTVKDEQVFDKELSL